MIPVRDLTTAADVIANYKRTRDAFFPSRQPVVTRVPATAKPAVDKLKLIAETRQTNELFPSEADSLEQPSTSPEVEERIIALSAEGLDEIPEPFRPRVRAGRIVEYVAALHGVTSEDILGIKRHAKIKDARFAAIVVVKKALPHWGLSDLGNFFNRDHTSIFNALKKMKAWERTRPW